MLGTLRPEIGSVPKVAVTGIEVIGQEAAVVANRLADVGRRAGRGNAEGRVGQIAPQGVRERTRERAGDDGVLIGRTFLSPGA